MAPLDGSQKRVSSPRNAEQLELIAYAHPPEPYLPCVAPSPNGNLLPDSCQRRDPRLTFWYAFPNGDLIHYANENDGIVLYWLFSSNGGAQVLVDRGYLQCE
jgi:hypothetical protein